MSSISKKLKNLKNYRCVIDPQLKDEIIVEYAPLIKYIAQKIADLYQITVGEIAKITTENAKNLFSI